MNESIRLSKQLAKLVSCSRREAELYIKGGWVRVDGEVIEEPHFKVLDQTIELHSMAKAVPLEPATMVFHHPVEADPAMALQCITPASHVENDSSLVRMLKSHFIGLTQPLPLQPGASGIVAFTQDWRVQRKLTEDADRMEEEYNVEVDGELAEDHFAKLRHGLIFEGKPLKPVKVSWQSEARLRFAIKNPRPGQIRFACEQVGLKVLSMKRLRIGRIALSKMPPGQWRYLGAQEQF